MNESTGPRSAAVAGAPVLRVSGVSKRFGPLHVLADVGLEIGRGEFVSIVGPSGCGKSTLLGLIAGLDTAYEGEIGLNGDSRSPRIGRAPYMHQRDLLLPWRTVLDNAILALELRGVGRREARERARAHLDEFGLTEFATAYPAEVSGGMRQRVSLLRATLTGGELLLLDEPFGALDAITRSSMHAWLSRLLEGSGTAALLVTHDVEEAVLLSDRVHVMTRRPGRIAATREVGLARPRDPKIVSAADFVALKADLLDVLGNGAEGAA